MNAANAITVARILLIPVFLVLLFSEVPYGEYLAVAVFALAAGTDKLDGYVARKTKTITATGIFLDPLADKLLISAALIALVSLGELPAWVAMVIIAREFAVTALRLFGAAQGVAIPADKLGKAKTVSQTVAILFLLLVPDAWDYGELTGQILIYIAVALTLVSGIQYFWNGRELLSRPPKTTQPGNGAGGDEGEESAAAAGPNGSHEAGCAPGASPAGRQAEPAASSSTGGDEPHGAAEASRPDGKEGR